MDSSEILLNQSIKNFQGIKNKERKLLVFVNPFSGTKQAKRIWEEAKKYIDKDQIKYDLKITTNQLFVQQYLINLSYEELIQYEGIISVSGDGLLHEIINTLNKRNDVESLSHIKLGVLPGGTSNAACYNILKQANMAYELKNLVFQIIENKTQKYNAMKLEIKDKNKVYKIFSFLQILWGIVADVDIGSEFMRCLGSFRYDLYAIWRIIFLRRYRTKLYLCFDDINESEMPDINTSLNSKDVKWKLIDDDFVYLNLSIMPYCDPKIKLSPLQEIHGNKIDVSMMHGNSAGRFKMLRTLIAQNENGDHLNFVDYKKVTAFRIENLSTQQTFFSIDGEKYSANIIQGFLIKDNLNMYSY